jgi:hypothetical protein
LVIEQEKTASARALTAVLSLEQLMMHNIAPVAVAFSNTKLKSPLKKDRFSPQKK